MRRCRKITLSLSLLFLLAAEKPEALTPEEQREQKIIERFQTVLEKNPRRGTALDRIYGYHVERGSLDKLIGSYRDRAKKDDGVASLVVGLLEAQRGRDAEAVAAFREAEKRLPNNALASYYLGQALVMVGQPDAAAEAFERALTRKPVRTDLLDIFQALGRVYQRAQRSDKALAVWARLEQQFPDDRRVQEQIVSTLAEEGQYEAAMPRYEKLAGQTRDPYQKATFRMEAAELKVRLKQTAKALADFENLLGELNPDSWLYREVRRKIEDVFLRGDDLAGLAKYYEGWVEKHPADIDAIARLARTLSNQGRMPEARTWLEKGLEKAPSRRELRQALIEQLVFEQKYSEAAAQYELMDKNDPNNPDTLREWGKLLLHRLGEQLQQIGELAAAAEHHRAAIRKEPAYLAYSFWEIQQVFAQLHKTKELVQIVEEIDFKSAGGNVYAFVQLLQPLFKQERTRAQGLKLFRNLWDAYPQDRGRILGVPYQDELWQVPEIYEYAQQAVLPASDEPVGPWQNTDQLTGYQGDGRPETLAEAVRDLLTPRTPHPAANAAGSRLVLDFLLLLQPRELPEARLTSILEQALNEAKKKPELRSEARAVLKNLLAEHPDDLSVRIAAALEKADEDKPEPFAEAVEKLGQLLAARPLEKLANGQRANARQRAEAAQQPGVWLIARQCLRRPSLHAAGEKWGERAVEATRRQLEPQFALAMLREWGQIELERGDLQAAEIRPGGSRRRFATTAISALASRRIQRQLQSARRRITPLVGSP